MISGRNAVEDDQEIYTTEVREASVKGIMAPSNTI